MYVNQIDDIIDKILDKLYLEGLMNNEVFQSIVEGNKINYVEYREKINKFIKQFMESLDINTIRKLINNKENLIRILDIIMRYVAYYYFLSLAYHYTGNIKDFRNNLIQYSKLQENSTFTIKNFFDTENNYQIIHFFKIIKDASKILTMTELQKKTLNPLEVKDAINFLNGLGKDYIDKYLLMIVEKGGEQIVEINVHNLIKTIVFREIYRNQEQHMVFEIVNDIEEGKHEYTYIDIVVTTDQLTDFESFRQIFLGEENGEIMARDLFELVNDSTKIIPVTNSETKNNNLLEFNIITPIVDDFIRYHRDSERLETDTDKSFMPLVSTNNAKNIQMALLYQQRKKKENTKAQLIVNKIDAIEDYYSDNVKNNPEIQKDIKKYFQNPLSYRKAILHNYLDEVRVINKIKNQGKRAVEGNEYFDELEVIIGKAYFNFKDFDKYGTSVNLVTDHPINMLRYSNIENKTQMPYLELDIHTSIMNDMVNMVGMALGPFSDGPIQCARKENLIDIRETKISYMKGSKVVTKGSENGYKAFIKIIKYFLINTISVSLEPSIHLYHDFTQMKKLNPDIFNKVIYWIYDIEKDKYEMDTYENVKSYNFQESIRFMNAILYDRIISFLDKKLHKLIHENRDLSSHGIETLIELFSVVNRLFLKQDEKRELMIRQYLQTKSEEQSQIMEISASDRIGMPEFVPITEKAKFQMKIDMINPLHPQEYIKLEAYSKEARDIISKLETKCKHEDEWNELIKLKKESLNKYNAEATQFIEKFVMETTELDFVCKICGQVLPLKQYVQDGNFDNITQKFITAYVPLDVALEEVKEYQKYKLSIRFLDLFINRISLITGTNMLVGPASHVKQKRKALVKNIIDIVVKHNSVNLKKGHNDDERLAFFSKKFNIDKDLDSVYFFELDDSIFNLSMDAGSTELELKKLKINNILLYFMLIFMTELNGAQITMMAPDKFANIYVYLKYGPQMFKGLLIKKNINDMETVPILNYPVLCYLIYVLAWYLTKYKIWYMPGAATTTKTFNLVYIKIIINSIVDIFNSISIDTGNMPNDYIYMLTTSKLYTQLNSTFKNSDIINKLKQAHIRYADKAHADVVPVVSEKDLIKTYSIADPIKIILKPRKIPDYKISSGIQLDDKANILYHAQEAITDITNCPYGSLHYWQTKGKEIQCLFCGEKGSDVEGSVDRTLDAYYYNLNIIANRRCLEGTTHDFVGRDGDFICTICGRSEKPTVTPFDTIYRGPENPQVKAKETAIFKEDLVARFKRQIADSYSRQDLDKLSINLNKIENEAIVKLLEMIRRRDESEERKETQINDLIKQLRTSYRKESGEKLYGQIVVQSNKLITILEDLIGKNTDLDIEKYPVYLRDNVYIIDHSYEGSTLPEPIILTQKDNRIFFKDNHPFFKTDVYYYSDNRTGIDVFYHAVTLKLIGYKEKHKEFTRLDRVNAYLKISPSIQERILTIGYETKYIDITNIFMENNKYIRDANENYFQILDNLIRDHIFKIKTIIDKFSSTVYKIKNYQPATESELPQIILQATKTTDILVMKYNKLLANMNLGENDTAFDEWNILRNSFTYEKINWTETNVRPTEQMYVNSDLINYYDIASNLMIYYLVGELISIIENNTDKITKINTAQMIIEIIINIYNIYNIDRYKNSMELKRFEYILNGSEVMIDLLKKGQGLTQSRELEQQLDDQGIDIMDVSDITEKEMKDLREEADALDVEGDYYAEEDEDYGQETADNE